MAMIEDNFSMRLVRLSFELKNVRGSYMAFFKGFPYLGGMSL
jgi:hypothetical protein